MKQLGLSQSELARRVSISQSAINHLIHGTNRSSTHLHKIAQALQTSPFYLAGETDDPDQDAPPPMPVPQHQLVSLAVALPSERVLGELFEAVLLASPKLAGAELAHELAKRLPALLAVGRLPLAAPAQDLDDSDAAPPPARAGDHPGSQRAQHR